MGILMNTDLKLRNQQAIEKANKLYKRLNTVWTKIEESIRAKMVLAPVDYKFKETDEFSYWIGIHKFDFKWRVCYGVSNKTSSKILWTPVLNCALEIRTLLLQWVPVLLEQIVTSNEIATKYLETSVEHAEQLAASFLEESNENNP